MDREMILQHLAQAERHAALGARTVARQKDLIVRLERDGLDVAEACAALARFEGLQEMHLIDVNRLRQKARKARSDEYRAKADACDRQAKHALDAIAKQQLGGVAQQWRAFADLVDRREM